MNIRRKGLSTAMTAILLSTLLASVAAPAALGAVLVTPVTVVPGGPAAGTATFTFQENFSNCFAVAPLPAGNELTVRITDSANASTVHFGGTPTAGGPGSLGTVTATFATTVAANDTLNINWTNSDINSPEQIVVSGVAITADAGAATGNLIAYLTGNEAGCVLSPQTRTATGRLGTPSVVAGSTNINAIPDVGTTTTPASCRFVVTGTAGMFGQVAGNLTFVTNAETKPIITAPAPVGGIQALVIGATTFAHSTDEVITQVVPISATCPAIIPSPGNIGQGIILTASTRTFVLPGENNQLAGTATWTETGAATFGTQTLTFTLGGPPGVRFSTSPNVNPTGGVDLHPGSGVNQGPGDEQVCALDVARRACTVTVVSDGAGIDSVVLEDVFLDVDATTPLGSPVTVTLTTSGNTPVTGGPATIAFVGRVIVAVAAQPTILIGVSDQESGMITLSESLPGFFVAGAGSNNTFGLCIQTGETFTRAPWAVVTQGNLTLLSGFVGASSAKGTLFNVGGSSCAYWTVFSATTGTVPSVIEIRGSANDTTPLPSGANNGPRLSVSAQSAPGSTQIRVLVGPQNLVTTNNPDAQISLVSNAIRAFRTAPIVAAVSQPRCNPGSTDCLGGNITITEQFNGQLKNTQTIVLRILPRATVQRQDVILKTGVTNDLPIVTTNANSGLLVTPVSVVCPPSALLGIVFCTASFTVTQQSFGPTLGQITVSNIHYIVAVDAVNGPVLVDVSSQGDGAGGPTGSQSFDQVVSNATIGPPPATPLRSSITNGTLPGVVKVTEGRIFTASTKVVDAGDYVTWQGDLDPAAAGERLIVWIAKKAQGGTSYSAFTRFSTRAVNSQGLTVFHYDNADLPGWVSVKWSFDGNAIHGPATSLARQAHYVP